MRPVGEKCHHWSIMEASKLNVVGRGLGRDTKHTRTPPPHRERGRIRFRSRIVVTRADYGVYARPVPEIRLWACPVPTLFSKAPIGRQVPGQCWWRVWGFQRLAVANSGWLARKATRFQLGSPAKALITTTHPYTPYSPTWWLEFWDTDGVRQSQQYMSDVHPLDWKISPRRTKVHFRKTQVPQPPKATHLRASSPRHERGVQPEIRRAESRDDGDDVYFVQ